MGLCSVTPQFKMANILFGGLILFPYLIGLWITQVLKLHRVIGSLVVLISIASWNWMLFYLVFTIVKIIYTVLCGN